MRFVTAVMVALVALVGMAVGQIDANVAASGNYAGQDNYHNLNVNVYSGGYGGYPYYYYDYPYYNGYGGTSIYINENVNQANYGGVQIAASAVVSGGQDGADGQPGVDGQSGDNVPASDTSVPEEPASPVVAPQVAVSANGMTMVDGGQSLQNEVMDSPMPLEYVTYMDYNVLVVETRGVPTDVAQKFGIAAITNHGYKAVYFVQGILVRADGSLENTTLDLTTPPRVARSLGYL